MIRPEFPPRENRETARAQPRFSLKPPRSGASDHSTTTATGTPRRTLARTETSRETDGRDADMEIPGHGKRGGAYHLGGRSEAGIRASRAERRRGKTGRGGLAFRVGDLGVGEAAGRFDAVAGFSFHGCACACWPDEDRTDVAWVDDRWDRVHLSATQRHLTLR
jgi:hypothetical protein